MARKLDPYRDKRDPARTNEPFGAEPMHSARATSAGRFVVHLHAATRQHFDLRIEVAGVLQSFAVPRGPSLDPAEKRLAVHTEDHPIDYLHFEAVIPAGNYGAGPMILWDYGSVHYLEQSAEQGLASGKIDFVLHGFKLRGRFALVQTKKNGRPDPKQWLLLKKPDAHVRAGRDVTVDEPHSVLSGLRVEELSQATERSRTLAERALALGASGTLARAKDLVPMRCAEGSPRLDDPRSIYELKLDGVRVLAERHGDQVSLWHRSGRNSTAAYPEIVRALRALPAPHVILDGEVVAFDQRGAPSFQRLAERLHLQDEREILAAQVRVPVVFVVFDVLALGEHDLRRVPLIDRKQLLAELLPGGGFVRLLDHAVGDGKRLLAFCQAQNLEGIVVKRGDSPYVSGPKRSSHWCKLKLHKTDDFVVVGYTPGRGKRSALGALEIASYAGERLVTRGRVGSGLDGDEIDQLLERFAAISRKTCAAEGELMPSPEGRTFVEPQLVVSVQHSGFTPDGRLRHPVYRGLRDEVDPSECVSAPAAELEATLTAEPAPQLPSPSRVKLTNTSKIFWPDEGITKGDLCEYYGAIADTLLPYLRDRPVLMVRYPDGIRGKHFFQWNVPRGTPSWIHTEQLHSEEHGREATFFRIHDRDTLLHIVNLGCIPLHVLASRFGQLEHCDFLTIDFDLGGGTLQEALTLARGLHGLLDELSLPSFPKTSGQTGLHVLVPLNGVPFEAATSLATLLGRLLHERHPKISTVERMRARRPQAVYIDTGQTGRSRAIVSPYSVRAYPGATVSTPLRWDEVGAALVPARFDIRSVRERLLDHPDPMRDLLTSRPDVAGALTRLEALVKRRML
ncbi:MAG TPA: DNA ligase D [Polyangiales bacterium]|nr:DNA ligase D [Polyangiales bacterium]